MHDHGSCNKGVLTIKKLLFILASKEEYMKHIKEDKVGVAIILCNGKEFNNAAREMEEVFKDLKFSTKFKEDASKEYIKDIVKIAAEAKYPENYKFVLYSISHGEIDKEKECIKVANNGKVYIEEDIIDKFQPDEPTGMHKIPKLFFFDTCRGETRDTGSEIAPMNAGQKAFKPKMPRKGNMLVAYSTHPGFQAAYNKATGEPTWSMLLMKELRVDQSIYEVLQKTNASLMEKYMNEKDAKIYQAPIFYSSLWGKETINLKKEAIKIQVSFIATPCICYILLLL